MRFLAGLVLVVLVALGGAWIVAGRMAGPSVQFVQPEKFVGVTTPFEAVVGVPSAQLSALRVVLEQNGKQFPVYALGDQGAEIKDEDGGRSRLKKPIGKQAVPDLVSGPARIMVTAERPVMYGMRK